MWRPPSRIKIHIYTNLGTRSNLLFSPCSCEGSVKYVHMKCLTEWIKTRMDDAYEWPSPLNVQCEICKSPYRIERRLAFAPTCKSMVTCTSLMFLFDLAVLLGTTTILCLLVGFGFVYSANIVEPAVFIALWTWIVNCIVISCHCVRLYPAFRHVNSTWYISPKTLDTI